ncbi:MAG: hypothetical protein HZB57_06665 [Gammaproteobacteria bacterium]|nr:hypothetical protein [Gammaproteobacteria bacterium]
MTDHAHIPSTHRCVSALVPARDEAACIVGVVRALFEQRRADGTPLIDEVVVRSRCSFFFNQSSGTSKASSEALATPLKYAPNAWSNLSKPVPTSPSAFAQPPNPER